MERVSFKEGKQREFISQVCGEKRVSDFWKENKNYLDISYSTFKKYYSERLKLPLNIFELLCNIMDLEKPSVEILPANWGRKKGGKKGSAALLRKYNQDILNKWRRKGGINSQGGGRRLRSIHLPKLNKDLAEFIGVHLGDGTLTNYFLRISGDKRYDLSYFNYLSNMVHDLSGIIPTIRSDSKRNTLYLEVRSKKFCSYLHDEFSIPYGNKITKNAIIPPQIEEEPELIIPCLRGLMDTDGSVSRRSNYLCLAFNSYNPALLEQVWKIGKSKKLFTHKYKDEVGTNSQKKILEFFKTVGSSNIRHIIRFCEWRDNNKLLYKEEVSKYFNKYQNVVLPYKMGP